MEMAPLEGEAILFDPQNNKFWLLNPTAAILWGRLAEAVTADQLAEQVLSAFEGVNQNQALEDVGQALEQLAAWDLVVTEPALESEKTLSRRSE